MYTGEKIFNQALAIIDELSETGTVTDSQVLEYKRRAPFLLDMWQREIAKIENVEIEEEITSLEQPLIISDKNCPSGAYYLAMHFALSDMNNELAAECRRKYELLKAEAVRPMEPTEIIDVYGVSNSPY